MRRSHPSAWLLALGGLAACASKPAPTGASASAAASTPAASAKPSAVAAKPSAPAPAKPAAPLVCPDGFYQSDSPAYCLKLDQARPGRTVLDGPWLTASIGLGAAISTSRTTSVEDAVKELRERFGSDDVKDVTKYKEEVDAGRTIVRYRTVAPDEDPVNVLVVVGRSDDTTVRCQVTGDMSEQGIGLSLVLPK
ncbi:MAG: hypothetical protein U0414_22770 [Polyangiaceae bacterium]